MPDLNWSTIYAVLGFVMLVLGLPHNFATARSWWRRLKEIDWKILTVADRLRLLTVLVGICLLIFGLSISSEPELQNNLNETEIENKQSLPSTTHTDTNPRVPSEKIYVREESLREVLRSVNHLPPLERQDYFKKAYSGRWAKWTGHIFNIKSHSSNSITVTVLDTLGPIPWMVHLDFPDERRPILEPLRPGDSIAYEGRIRGNYDRWSVNLEDPKILEVHPYEPQ